jgi:20S proteasome subunit beta 1
VAFTFDKGVMIAADTRTSTGNYIANRVTDKITPLADSVYILRSGSAADTQAIASYVQFFIAQHQAEKGDHVDVETAANLVQQLAYNNKAQMSAGMIVAGHDKTNGASIFAVPLGGTLLKVPYALGGSGSAYISGYCDKYYRSGMTEADCRAFVVKALGHAIRYDSSSGGCVRIVTVDEAGARREFIPNTQIPIGYGELAVPIR